MLILRTDEGEGGRVTLEARGTGLRPATALIRVRD